MSIVMLGAACMASHTVRNMQDVQGRAREDRQDADQVTRKRRARA